MITLESNLIDRVGALEAKVAGLEDRADQLVDRISALETSVNSLILLVERIVKQLCLPRPAAATVMAHPIEDGTDRHIASRHVCLVDQLNLAAAVALDPQKPRWEDVERFVKRLLAGRERVSAVAAPVASWDRTAHPGRCSRASWALT